jgi:hypothetical protein
VTIGCDPTVKRTCWWSDQKDVAEFARWLYNRRFMFHGADMLDYFDNPTTWVKNRLAGDLRVEYEKEREA